MNIQSSIIPQVQGQLYLISNAIQNKTAFLANVQTIPANIIGFGMILGVMYAMCQLIALKGQNKDAA